MFDHYRICTNPGQAISSNLGHHLHLHIMIHSPNHRPVLPTHWASCPCADADATSNGSSGRTPCRTRRHALAPCIVHRDDASCAGSGRSSSQSLCDNACRSATWASASPGCAFEAAAAAPVVVVPVDAQSSAAGQLSVAVGLPVLGGGAALSSCAAAAVAAVGDSVARPSFG